MRSKGYSGNYADEGDQSSMLALAVAQLAVFAILALLALYVTVKHGRPGLFGWLHLIFFCVLRATGSAMHIAKLQAAMLVSIIGPCLLLLAFAGILQESKHYHRQEKAFRWIRFGTIFYHVLLITSVILLAVGITRLQSDTPISVHRTFVVAGLGLMTASWSLLLLRAIGMPFFSKPIDFENVAAARSFNLMLVVMFSLIFSGIRIIYLLVAVIYNQPVMNLYAADFSKRVWLGFLPEFAATVLILAGGLYTRNIKSLSEKREQAGTSN